MNKNGIYIVKDKYFTDFSDSNLKQNKGENRPSYYAVKEESGILWLIPMTTQLDKMKERIAKKESQGKKCDVFHIENICGAERGFIIGDIFPVLEEYIEREYTISHQAVVIKNERVIKDIRKKANKVLALIRKGIKLHNKQPNVLEIEKKLLERIKSNTTE